MAACAFRQAPLATELHEADRRDLDARAALGHLGGYAESDAAIEDALESNREAASLALRLGNLDEAAGFARAQLDLGRTLVLVESLRGDEDSKRDAERQLDHAARFAVDLGDEISDARLVVEAAQFMDRPTRRRGAIRRALTLAREADLSWGYEALWDSFGRNPARRAELQRLRWRSHPASGMPIGASRLDPEQIGDRGPEAVDLLQAEVDRAARDNRASDLARWTDALIDADPHEAGALAIRVVLDAVAHGDLASDPELLPDLSRSGGSDPLGSAARMLVRQRVVPGSRALMLARAQAMLSNGGFGDAGQLLVEYDELGSKATQREQALRDQLEVQISFESATPAGVAGYRDWVRRRSTRRSASVHDIATLHDQAHAPESERDLSRASGRVLLGMSGSRAIPWLDPGMLEQAAVDHQAGPRTRERARTAIAAADPSHGARLGLCRERKLFDGDCTDLLAELAKLDHANPEFEAGLDALGAAANTRAEWLSSAIWLDSDQLRAAQDRLSAFEGTRVALTTDFQTAAIFSELAANRPDLARARLASHGALIRPESAAVAAMALLDLEEGLVEPQQIGDLLLELPPADLDASWMLESWLPGDPTLVAELFPGNSRLAHLARGLALARMGAWRAAASELAITLDQNAGLGRAVVAGRLALVAELAGEDELRERALEVVEFEQPNSFFIPYVRARAAERIGDHETAHPLYLAALLRRPRATVALEGALRTLPLGKQTAERVREVFALFPDSGVHWQLGELLDLSHGEIDGPTMVRLWLARVDGSQALAIGEPAAKWRVTGEVGLGRLLALLEAAQTPDVAFPLAARTVAWLGAMPPAARAERRELEVWLTFLIGRTSELEALTKARPLRHGLRQPTLATHPSLPLAKARDAGAIDDVVAWAIVRDQLWASEDPQVVSVITELTNTSPADSSLAEFACVRLLQRSEHELAAERCVPVWQQLEGSPYFAIDFAFIALNHPELLHRHGLDPSVMFATAAKFPALAAEPLWLLNHSLWLSSQGDHAAASDLRVAQLALGGGFGVALDPSEYGQVFHRGALARQQLIGEFVVGDRRSWALAGAMALRGLDLRAAELFARRLLAWVPATDDAATPDLTARAPQLLAAERLEGETSDADLRSMAYYVLHASALVADDLAAGRIDRELSHELMEAYADEFGLSAYESVLRRAPDSHFAKLIVLSALRESGMRDRSTQLARELVAVQPHDPLILSEALPALLGADDLRGARTLLAEARVIHPGHPWLRDDALPAVLTGADDRVPAWLRDPDSFDRQLAAITDAAVDRLQPTRHFHTTVAAEVFFAATAKSGDTSELGVREPIPTARSSAAPPDEGQPLQVDRVQFVIREPRASRCEGLACAEPLISEWAGRGYALLWTRELEIPAGPAIEFVATDGESMVDTVIVPTGGSLFVLINGSSPEDFDAFLPTVKLMRESFRPLDFSLDAFSAETLRTAGAKPASDLVRHQARRAVARAASKSGCPVSAQLQPLDAVTRAELLLDVWLTTRTSDQRLALLSCVRADSPEAGRLALPALLDGRTEIHEFGRAAAASHTERLTSDARRILFGRPEVAGSDPRLTDDLDAPPFGLLQVLAVLPTERARALTDEMLGHTDVRLRSLALAASATIDYFVNADVGDAESMARVDPKHLRTTVTKGTETEALFAAASLLDLPGRPNTDALRARADGLIVSKAGDDHSRALAVDLAWGLAQQLVAADRRRLDQLADAIVLEPSDGKHRRAERARDAILDLTEDHGDGRKAMRASEVPTDDETPSRWARARRSPPPPRTRETLANAPLAELLPGTQWTFVRVDNAGLFAASLSDLLRRLAPGAAADAYLVRSLIHDVLLQGFTLLEDDGGLDLVSGIECATPKGSEGFVCSANVRDRAAVLSVLAERGLGNDAGLTIPLALVTQFAGLPVSLGSLPILLHGFVDIPNEDLDSSRAPEIARERLRTTRVIAGQTLEYYATIELREDSLVVDSEHYLFLDDRLLVFSGAHLAELVLRELPKGAGSLASAPAFQSASARWRAGAGLQAVDLADAFGLDEVALDLVFTSDGLEFSAHARGRGPENRDIGRLDALLPGDPITRIGVVLEPDDLRDSFEDLDLGRCSEPRTPDEPEPCGLQALDRLPPVGVAEAAAGAVLGWYPEDDGGLWSRWVFIVPLDAKVEAALAAAKVPALGRGAIVGHDGMFWQTRDDALIVASSESLAEQARLLPAAPATAAGSPTPFVAGAMHGQRAAKFVRGLAARFDGDRRGELLRVLATMLGLIGEVDIAGAWERGGDGSLHARIDLNLARSEEELALIDRWLADPEVGNAVKLPRRLSSLDTQGRIELLVRVDDAKQFATASLPSNPRISVAPVNDDSLRIALIPSSMLASGAGSRPLTKPELARALASDELVRAEATPIREVAETLVVEGDPAATVAAVVAWAHDRIRYEITPTSLDAVAVLERGKGDCTEYALLTVALLRAAGIPAELREGLSVGGDEMVAHAWAAWHDGQRWNEVDPTAGTVGVGAGHLEIEVIDVLALISLGRFEVIEVETSK